MKGSFEDIIGYIVIIGTFILVIYPLTSPLISTFRTQATDPKITLLWTFVLPFVFLCILYAFYKRLMGEKPLGENSSW